MPDPLRFVLLLAAGLVAGAVGAAGGITSLVSYSALLAAGIPPVPATASNLVASVACWPGSALTSRRERVAIRGTGRIAVPVAAVAAAGGSLLLLVTPPGVFARGVPFLVAAASVTLLAQPWLTARAVRPGRARLPAWPFVGLVSVYSGYFGAGSGILLLTVALVLVDERLPEANALKNMLLGVTSSVSAVIYAIAGAVDWPAVAVLGLGLFGGSTLGPVVARRVPARAIRWTVAALGLVLAVRLWFAPG